MERVRKRGRGLSDNRPAGSGRDALPPRLRRLCEAALALGGDLRKVQAELGMTRTFLVQEVSRLRSCGVARSASLFDPAATGRVVECVSLVRVALADARAVGRLESWFVEDPTITCALRVSGRFDYRLTTFHRDRAEANRWRRLLEARPAVLRVEQSQVRTVLGDQLGGLVMRRAKGARSGA